MARLLKPTRTGSPRAGRALRRHPSIPPSTGRFPRGAWGDQSLKERIPTFLEALLFEAEAKTGAPRA